MKPLFLLLASLNLFATPFSHKVALKAVNFAPATKKVPFTGFYRLEKQSALFFKDLGAKFFEYPNGLKGFYLSFDSVKFNSGKTFGKWKDILRKPKNTKLLGLFEANLASSDLPSLFSFPNEVRFQKGAKNATVIVFLDYTIPLTMQTRDLLNLSLRGYNVLAVDFYSLSSGKHLPTWDECKKIADAAYKTVDGKIIVYGKSYGAGAAAYLGSKYKISGIILDRPFSSMQDVAQSVLLKSFIETHYEYPVSKLITSLKIKPLIVESEESGIFTGHGRELLSAYIQSKKNIHRDRIIQECFISTRGGHYCSLLNSGISSWFSYNEAQKKLNHYLVSSEIQ